MAAWSLSLCEEGETPAVLLTETGPAVRERLTDIARAAFMDDTDTSVETFG